MQQQKTFKENLLILTIAGNVTSTTLYLLPNQQSSTDNNSMNAKLLQQYRSHICKLTNAVTGKGKS